MKLTKERRWWLNQFGFGCWTVGQPNLVGVKKWDAHSAALVKMGLLEREAECPGTYRITEAGRKALEESKG